MRVRAWVAVFLLACAPSRFSQGGGDGTTAAEATETSTSSSSTDPPPPSTSSSAPPASTSSSETSDSDPSTGEVPVDPTAFLQDPDWGGVSIECDVWDQDCPPGQKCMPWANDGGNSWNASRCSPIDPDPDGIDEACTVEGSGVSGIDSCEFAAMCWNVDPKTNEGTCVPFCVGSESSPDCEDPNRLCSLSSEGVLILCLPGCHPLEQDCGGVQGCYPPHYSGLGDLFVCVPHADFGEGGEAGTACEYTNVCAPGLACIDDSFSDCSSYACCTPYCDITTASMCPAGDQECVPWFEEGQAPPGLDDVGICTVPS